MAETRLDMLLKKKDWDLLAEASRQGSERMKRPDVAGKYGWIGPDGKRRQPARKRKIKTVMKRIQSLAMTRMG